MPVIPSIGGQILDDVYLLLTNPPQSLAGVNTSAVGVVGTCLRGIPGAVYNFGSYGQAVQSIGPSSLAVTGPLALQNLIRQKCGDIYFVPAFGAGAAAASITLSDATSTPALILTVGDANPQTGTLQASFGTLGNAATAVVAAGGSAGEFNLTVTSPDGRRVDTFTNLTLANMVATINLTAKAAIASLPSVPNPTGAPTTTPSATGGTLAAGAVYGKWTWTNANGETLASQEFTVTIPTGSTGSFTFEPATGAPTSATGFKLYLSSATGTETFSTDGATTTTVVTVTALPTAGAASPPTVNTAAISGAAVPAAGSFTFSGGSQGAATVDGDYIGTTLPSGAKTGLAALATVGSKLSFVLAAEQSSAAINAAVQAFGAANNCEPLICLPQGTTASAAITSVATYSQAGMAVCYPWQTVYDPDIQANRTSAPTSFAAGVGAALAPSQSFGNKPVLGSVATDVALSETDISNLVAANIMVVGVSIPAGGIGIRNGQDSTGVQMFVKRMQYFLSQGIQSALGTYVDQLQSTSSNDPLRRNVRGSVGMFLQSLMGDYNAGVLGQIDNYSVTCDLTNNTPQSIASDELFCDTAVNLLSNAGKIYVRANIGQGVQITSSAA